MRKAARPALLALLIAVTGCAGKDDVFDTSGAGYVRDAAAYVASADWSRAETTMVELSEFDFAPAMLTFREGTPYRLRIENSGGRTHYFVSAGFFRAIAVHKMATPAGEIEASYLESIVVTPGTTKELFFIPVEKGEYALKCTAPLHTLFGMVGTIRIF